MSSITSEFMFALWQIFTLLTEKIKQCVLRTSEILVILFDFQLDSCKALDQVKTQPDFSTCLFVFKKIYFIVLCFWCK